MEEVWFAGAHGDIGGGWLRKAHETRTLSTVTLKWMIQEIINLPDTPHKVKFGKEKEWAPTVDVKDLAQDNSRPKNDLDRYVLVTDEKPPVFPKPHDNLIIGRANRGVTGAIRTIAWRCMGKSSLTSCNFDVCSHWKWRIYTNLHPSRVRPRDSSMGTEDFPGQQSRTSSDPRRRQDPSFCRTASQSEGAGGLGDSICKAIVRPASPCAYFRRLKFFTVQL